MAITTIIEGVVTPRHWVGSCPGCNAKYEWEDTDAIDILPHPAEGDKARIQCQTVGCGVIIVGTPKQ